MHITITGNLGSGKSTICRLLNEKYGYEVYSTGKIQRELAKQMNMTTLELNQLMCSDKKYDTMIDDETARISRENRNKDIIFDSRLAWHFVEHSFKVFVSVSLDVAAERVMKDQRGNVESYSSLEEAKSLLARRAATERARYKDIYNLNYMDFDNYNLVIDSTYTTPELIAGIILHEAKEFYKDNKAYGKLKHLLSPERLISTDDISTEDEERLQPLISEYKKADYTINELITVRNTEDGYEVIDDVDKVKAALLASVPYVRIRVEG